VQLGAYLASTFQLGYVTADMGRAVAVFKEKLGIREFAQFETDSVVRLRDGEAPFRIHVALANLHDRQVELIQPIEGVVDFYSEGLDLGRSAAVLHHVGILVGGPEAEWERMKSVVRQAGYEFVLEDMRSSRDTHFAYADARADYGHYLEFLWRGPEAQSRHASMPDQAL